MVDEGLEGAIDQVGARPRVRPRAEARLGAGERAAAVGSGGGSCTSSRLSRSGRQPGATAGCGSWSTIRIAACRPPDPDAARRDERAVERPPVLFFLPPPQFGGR